MVYFVQMDHIIKAINKNNNVHIKSKIIQK